MLLHMCEEIIRLARKRDRTSTRPRLVAAVRQMRKAVRGAGTDSPLPAVQNIEDLARRSTFVVVLRRGDRLFASSGTPRSTCAASRAAYRAHRAEGTPLFTGGVRPYLYAL